MFKVLIVEDEEMIRKGLRYTFPWQELDCIVIDEACNGEEGIEKISRLHPDIVVTDVGMPIITGIEMLKATIKEYSFSAVILSVLEEFELVKDAMTLGVIEYLLKPLEAEEMYYALQRAKERLNMKRNYEMTENAVEKLDMVRILDFKSLSSENIHSQRIQKLIGYVEENYPKKITMSEMTEYLNASSTYLNTKLKEATGFTFNEFLNRYRIQKAIDKICTTDEKILTIAESCGFKEYKYFVQVFKKFTGVEPRKFSIYNRKEI